MHTVVRWFALLLALLWLPVGGAASAKKHPPTARHQKPPQAVPKGRLVRVIPVRVTLFYSVKDKKTGELFPMAAVSKTLKVKVVKPNKTRPVKRK